MTSLLRTQPAEGPGSGKASGTDHEPSLKLPPMALNLAELSAAAAGGGSSSAAPAMLTSPAARLRDSGEISEGGESSGTHAYLKGG